MESSSETPFATQPGLTFVLRVWPEPCLHGNERWRGEVVHLTSGQRRPFFDLATVVSFIRAWADRLGERQ